MPRGCATSGSPTTTARIPSSTDLSPSSRPVTPLAPPASLRAATGQAGGPASPLTGRAGVGPRPAALANALPRSRTRAASPGRPFLNQPFRQAAPTRALSPGLRHRHCPRAGSVQPRRPRPSTPGCASRPPACRHSAVAARSRAAACRRGGRGATRSRWGPPAAG